jgi:hypothetical protein
VQVEVFLPLADMKMIRAGLLIIVFGACAGLGSLDPGGSTKLTAVARRADGDRTTVAAGQRLGHHIGSQTMSDIAIRIETPGGLRLVSYFEAMTDGTFAPYQARGAGSRGSLILSRAARDASPLSCNGEQFTGASTLADWFDVQ